ncbi:hypothetical protein ACT8ZV_07590 [Nocardioides sp. MAHUQ-72]|uniref:hypothetical protein n=1 Tax=unclassified Nocardioides TaxID=2615069 RepID=UPI0036102A55
MVKQQTQVLTGATIALLVVLGVVAHNALVTEEPLAPPPLWLLATQGVAGLAAHLLCDTIGYRAPALAPSTPREDATRIAVASFQSRLMLRIALSESIALMSLSAGFVLGGAGAWPAYLSGAAVSAVLLAVHCWPWSRPVDRTERALAREGARVELRQAFGLEPRLTGPIQEL